MNKLVDKRATACYDLDMETSTKLHPQSHAYSFLWPDELADLNPDWTCLNQHGRHVCTRSVDHVADGTPCTCACGTDF